MRAVIVAVNHQIQPTRIISQSSDGGFEAFEQGQKERFAQVLREKIRERGIQFIGEEARYGDETIAEAIRGQANCRHVNIEMPPEERARRKIPAGYYEDPNLPEAEKTRCNHEREEYMADRIITEAGEAQSILVICGRIHAQPIAEWLVGHGHSVETIDLRDQDWYVEDWMEHMLNL